MLGRLDSALHVDLGLGAGVDSLLATPKRNGSLGFDEGAVQRRTREVGDLVSVHPPSTNLVDGVEEAQKAAMLDDDVLEGLSGLPGVPSTSDPPEAQPQLGSSSPPPSAPASSWITLRTAKF